MQKTKLKKLSKFLLLWILAILFGVSAHAQSKVVTGKVTDAKGDPLESATISAVGSKAQAVTNSSGSFSISVGSNVKRFRVSHVGFADKEVEITGNNLTISLTPQSSELENVVVIGYGSKKIQDATGAVATLNSRNFNTGVVSTPENLFQGKISGVNVTAANGQPGGPISINIRGTSSIRSDNNPLIVVDGVPLAGGTAGQSTASVFVEGSTTAQNPLAFINPNDIANISVLKDASAAAIYGTRGANGVILITTKSGRAGAGSGIGLQVSYNRSYSVLPKKYDLANPQEFVWGVRQSLERSGLTPDQIYNAVTAIDKGYNTDWQDQIFRTAYANNLNLSWGFSTKSTQLRLSASYDNIEGIVKNSDLERITLRANLNQKIYKDIVKLDIQANASNVANQYPPISNNAGYQGSLIGAAISYNPTFPVFNPDGTYFDNKDGNRNPAAMLEYFKAKDNQNAYLLNGSLTVQPITGLFIKGTVGLENRSTDYRGFADPRVPSSQSNTLSVLGKNYDNSDVSGNGRAINQISAINNLLTELTVSYTKTWKSGTLDLLGGISQQQYDNFGRTKIYWGTNNPNGIAYNFSDYANSTPYFANLNDSATYALQSQFFRANYNLLDRYFFTFTIRRDGSSKFPTNNQFGNFPAFAFKWKILNENWAKPAQKVLDYLDIRVQWGVTGNQEFPPYAQLALRQLNFVGVNSPFTSANPDLKWEQTVSTGVGVDFSFIDGRIKGSVDYFNRNTKDLLLLVPYPQPAASNDRWVNLPGNVINEGYDWNLDFEIFRPKTRRNFGWTLSLNGIHLRNEVTNFGPTEILTGAVSGQGLTGAYAQKILNGYALYSWSMPTFLRFDGNGYSVLADGGVDKIQGNPIPAFTGGLTTTFTLNGFRLSLLFNSQQDFYIYNNTANALFLKGSLKTAHNVTREVVNSIENPINLGSVSSRFLERGDFVRLQNVSFSYDFRMKPKQAVKTLSVALIGQNLALWTNYSGLDPEVNIDKNINGVPSRGFDYTGFPRARTFSLQVNIGF